MLDLLIAVIATAVVVCLLALLGLAVTWLRVSRRIASMRGGHS